VVRGFGGLTIIAQGGSMNFRKLLVPMSLAATLLAISPPSEAGYAYLAGASCVPNAASADDVSYGTSGAIKNNDGSAEHDIICAGPDNGLKANYSVTMKFVTGSQFEGGTDCALRATQLDGYVMDTDSENYYGQAIYQLAVTASNLAWTTSYVRCSLPINNSNGTPGVYSLSWTSS
jgi:hypothetical protein